MQIMDVELFQAKYAEWLPRVKPLLEAANWKDAFAAGWPIPVNTDAPWTPLAKPLSQCTVALFSTAGLYVAGEQQPFDAANIEGDWSFREIPTDRDPGTLKIAHTHYNHASAEQDLNAVFPTDRLKDLVREGLIGGLAPIAFSTSGYCTRLDIIVTDTAPTMTARLKEIQADAVLHIPV